MELVTVLTLKGRKRLAKAPPSKGELPKVLKLKNRAKTQRNGRERMFTEMEICLEVQLGIEQGPISTSALGEVSISESLAALEGEPEVAITLSYFKGTNRPNLLKKL